MIKLSSKLNLDKKLVSSSRELAANIARQVHNELTMYSTVAVERSILRLLGIDGVNESGVPICNVIVEQLEQQNALSQGVSYYIGNACLATGLSPIQIAQEIAKGMIDITKLPKHSVEQALNEVNKYATMAVELIKKNRQKRESLLNKYTDNKQQYIYVIVASGNIYEDIIQAKAVARQGADIVAVIRTTGQSLLDYVPYGATTEGFGGTYATQENFRLMRQALDEVGAELNRYIRLCNYCSGLCMPEIAAMGAIERLDVMLNDALYGILFRDINMKRTLIDQHFSRIINGFAGIIINTGEDNYLTTADAVTQAHTVLSSQLINEQFALIANIPSKQMGLGHAYEIDPSISNGFLYEISQAQMAREIFPDAPLKYMPPTKFMTGNIFKGQVQNTLFNVASVMTGQKIHLLGMMTEAIHTPFMSDRAIAIDNATYVFNTMKDIDEEISFKKGGIIQSRAAEVLSQANGLLQEIDKKGLMQTIEQGVFAGIKRKKDGGKGLDGVFVKASNYFNPFMTMLKDGVYEK